MKIDKRRHYILVVDTETANTHRVDNALDFSSALVYDCGWCVCDTAGNIYLERSFANADLFFGYADLLNTAYYANKLPQYWEDIKAGKRKLATTATIRRIMIEDMVKFGIIEVMAHNARFDLTVLNATIRYMTKSAKRYWFPYGTEIWDSMKMSKDVICKMPTYKRFCEENNLLTKTGRVSASAENLYKFISKNSQFAESHTGLEDVQIEREIFFYCRRQKKKMRKKLFEN